MSFGPFIGVNHHMQTTLLGAGLLFGETTEDFKWLFQTWVHAMGDVHPKTIITDQDHAIGAAIAAIFPNTRHLLCMWHINKKLPEKLSHVIHEHPRFKSAWNNCLYATRTIGECEHSWTSMLEEFDLHNNAWLRYMWELRHMWIPAFTRSIFSAGMRTTGRSESINAFFDGFINHRSSLMDFANGYARALERRREAEEKAEFESFQKKPALLTKLEIEAEMGNVYTLAVFKLFQEEVEESMYYFPEKIVREDVMEQWSVHKYDQQEQSRWNVVSWDGLEEHASCSCQKFESSGIICRHIMALFRYFGLKAMPPSHILKRWTKAAKVQFKDSGNTVDMQGTQSQMVSSHALAKLWSELKQEALLNPAAYEIVRNSLVEARSRVLALHQNNINVDQPTVELSVRPSEDAADNFISSAVGSQTSRPQNIQNPHIAITKGRSSKRLKGALERSHNGAKLCSGCKKFVVGHDRRNCPELKK